MSEQGTTVFTYHYRYSFDEKNRITIPSAWREMLGDNARLYALRHADGTIAVLPKNVFDEAEKKAREMNSRQNLRSSRRIFSNALTCEPDKQGRITLPPEYLAHAQITKEAVFGGSGHFFNIYSPQAWDDFNKPQDNDDDVLAQLGI